MSTWQFSESSEPLLKQCLEAITLDKNNKWIQKFGARGLIFEENNEFCDEITNDNWPENLENNLVINQEISLEKINVTEELENVIEESEDLRYQITEIVPGNLNDIVERCSKNIRLFSSLALQLPPTYIEKLCEKVFNTPEVNKVFIKNFYTHFIPTFLKRDSSRLSVDLLIKAKADAVNFKHLLDIIIKNVEVSSNILQDFIVTLNNKEQTDFLKHLSEIDISEDVFIHHKHTILILYKDCPRNKEVQNFIFTQLTQVAQTCVHDKTYGRLLLCFLQTQNNVSIDIKELERIVDIHRSAFKKSCLNVLERLKEKNN